MTERAGSPSPSDPGLLALESIREFLHVEDEWSQRVDRSFAWWGWLQAQVVAAAPVREMPSGVSGSQVIVFTDLAWCEELTKESIAHLWDLCYRAGPGGRPHLDASGERIVVRLASTAFVHAGLLDQMAGLLSVSASFQLFAAAKEAPVLEGVGLQALVSARPGSQPRQDPAEAVTAVAEMVGETPEGTNAWSVQKEFDEAGEMLTESAGLECDVREHFVSTVVPAGPEGTPYSVVIAQVTEGHPDYGSGLVITTHTPREIRPDAARDHLLPLLMNRAELGDPDGPVAFGSWCAAPSPMHPDDKDRLFLTHTAFWPSFTFSPGLLSNHLALHSVGRARRAPRWIGALDAKKD